VAVLVVIGQQTTTASSRCRCAACMTAAGIRTEVLLPKDDSPFALSLGEEERKHGGVISRTKRPPRHQILVALCEP
jgi:hypothetical protein